MDLASVLNHFLYTDIYKRRGIYCYADMREVVHTLASDPGSKAGIIGVVPDSVIIQENSKIDRDVRYR